MRIGMRDDVVGLRRARGQERLRGGDNGGGGLELGVRVRSIKSRK